MRNVEYSILLVMSELSTVRCDRALGLWIAGTRAQAATEGGFLGLRHKTKEDDGG